MRKYWAVLKVAWRADTFYGLSVIVWRVRVVMRVLVVYILWSSLLLGQNSFSGYSSALMLSYILLTLVVQAVVFSSRTIDVSSDISSGDLVNTLLKPINYFKYYLAQDLGNKTMNFSLSVVEFALFLYFFKPNFFIQTDVARIFLFAFLLILAVFVYYFINISLGFLAFYIPENVWAPRFLFFMVLDFLAGGLFPLDILPPVVFEVLMLTPFPYLLYFPIGVYSGRFSGRTILIYGLVGLFWVVALFYLARFLWRVGLKAYEAWGR